MRGKVAIYMYSFVGGGGAKVLIRTANNLRSRGYNVVLVVAEPEGENPLQYENDCEIIYAPAPLRSIGQRILWLSRVKVDAEFAIATFFPTAFSVFLSRVRFRKRIYYIQAYEAEIFSRPMRGLILRPHYYLLARLSYYLPLVQIVNCEGSRAGLSSRRRWRAHQIEPGIDPVIYHPIARSDGILRIGHLGRRLESKGSGDFFAAMKILRDMGESFEICVAYDHWPETSGLEYEVIQPTDERELAHFYGSCDIVVSTTWIKGFGYPPLEAMACGSVSFATPMDFGAPYVDHIPIRPRDPQSIVQAFFWFKENPDKVSTIKFAGMQTAKTFYWANITEKWLPILR